MTDSHEMGSCPVPSNSQGQIITLAHGEGGKLSRQLIEEVILPVLGESAIGSQEDAAVIELPQNRIHISTDSYVVTPLFFPGGDIGSLAINGTVNDLLVSGADPQWLTLSLIIEEGFSLAVLRDVLSSISRAARETGIKIATGDTKVVPHGAVDGIYINTTGVGISLESVQMGSRNLQPGDQLIVTGPIGQHGIAILSAREELGFEPPPQSDCQPLCEPVKKLLQADVSIRAMRDATRGGLATVLHEWAGSCGHTLMIEEEKLPVAKQTKAVCELLGLDPLFSACEGTMLLAIAKEDAANAVQALRESEISREATIIGEVQDRKSAPVTIRRLLGIEQPIDEPVGSQFPRIC